MSVGEDRNQGDRGGGGGGGGGEGRAEASTFQLGPTELGSSGPLQTTMIKDDQDIKFLDVEGEDETHSERAPAESLPHQSRGQRVCPRHRMGLILLGLICIAAIATVAFGISGHRLDTDLWGMQGGVSSVNRTLSAALAALKHRQADNMKRLVKVEAMVKNLTETLKDTKVQIQDQISKLRVTFRTLSCNLQKTKRNQTGGHLPCCPPGWTSSLRSCYWFSKTEKTWEEAKVDCEDKDAHLAVITSYLEQLFVSERAKPRYTWIGLTSASGSWKWVDGTSYTVRRIDWRPRQPVSISSPLRGETAYCAHLHRDGLWSSEHCTRQYNWVCETEARG